MNEHLLYVVSYYCDFGTKLKIKKCSQYLNERVMNNCKAYILHVYSSAYEGRGMDCIIEALDKGGCWKKILNVIASKSKEVYLLFDTYGIALNPTKYGIKFILDDNDQELKKSFNEFVDKYETILIDRYFWSYANFAELIDDLKWKMVNDDVTDDPFPSYEWRLTEVYPDENSQYVTHEVDDSWDRDS